MIYECKSSKVKYVPRPNVGPYHGKVIPSVWKAIKIICPSELVGGPW